MILCCFSHRNPGSFPIEYARYSHLICSCTDISDHGCLTLNSRSIAIYKRILGSIKTVSKSVSIFRSIAIGGLCNNYLFAVILHNILCYILHVFHGSIPVRVIRKSKNIVIYFFLFQTCCNGINLLIVLNIGIMENHLDVFFILFRNLSNRFASGS